MSVNKAIIIGYLGKDPEVRYTPDGTAIANFTIATNEARMKKDGKKEMQAEWHRIVAFGKLAEVCGEYLTKGKQVYIEGRIRTRQWEDREGDKRSTTEIVASRMHMLGSAEKQPDAAPSTENGHDDLPAEPDDVPF